MRVPKTVLVRWICAGWICLSPSSTTAAQTSSQAAQEELAEAEGLGFLEFYQSDKQRLRADSQELTIRVFAFKKIDGQRRIGHLGDLGGRGASTLRLEGKPGEHQFIVIVEEPDFKASVVDPRSVERLQPNVTAMLVKGHLTRVQIGLFGGGIDSRSGLNRGPIELTRVPTSRNELTYENPITSATSPAASQFQTLIVVEEPKPLKKR